MIQSSIETSNSLPDIDINSYKVVNIVASGKIPIEQPISLSDFASKNSNVTYDNRFPGAIIRINQPKSVVLLFNNGKIVITGLKNKLDVESIVPVINEMLDAAGIQIGTFDYNCVQIQNIIVCSSLNRHINLPLMCTSISNVFYDPEMFPAAIYRMTQPKLVFLIFRTGKFICMGAKDESLIKKGIMNLRETMINSEILFL